MRIEGGDGQEGDPGSWLPLMLEVKILDARGRPVSNRRVTWEGAENGHVEGVTTTTDGDGRATARFQLGEAPGPAAATARVDGMPPVRFTLRVKGAEPEPGIPYDVFHLLDLVTYAGSGETVHPDVALTPGFGFQQLMAITPYPGGDAGYENPSVFDGRSARQWLVPAGLRNPVALPLQGGHLSDPDLVVVPESGELYLYYRAADGNNRILLTRSRNGMQWTAPQEILAVPNHRLISPAVVRRGPGDWWMWSIDGGSAGCSARQGWLEVRRSMDGFNWLQAERLDLAHDGLFPWHVDVQWIPSRAEFWAVYNAKHPGSCTTPALFLARSPDGRQWTPTGAPLLTKGVIPELRDIVYRATFRYDPANDDLWLWVSGARLGAGSRYTWRTALQRRRAGEVLNAVPMLPPVFEPAPLELTEWP